MTLHLHHNSHSERTLCDCMDREVTLFESQGHRTRILVTSCNGTFVSSKTKLHTQAAFLTVLYLSIVSFTVQEVREYLIRLINDVYLYIYIYIPILKVYLPDSSHSRLPGRCKMWLWLETHACLEIFLEMYVAVVFFLCLDTTISPHEYPDCYHFTT